MPLLTELGNVLGWISTKMSPLTGLGLLFNSLHGLTQQEPGWFFLDKIFAGRKFKIVKRDMELIRLLLVQQETGEPPAELESYSVDDQLYNLELMSDAGFIIANFSRDTTGSACAATIRRLTWSGHDFLDATKDSKVWKMAKDHIIKPGAAWTFSLLLEWLKQQAHQRVFGVPTSSCDSTPSQSINL